jgi:hypothetical protein
VCGYGVQFRGDVRPARVDPLWEFPAIRSTDKIEQAQASSPVCISGCAFSCRSFSCRIFSGRSFVRASLLELPVDKKMGRGARRIALLPRFGRAKSDGKTEEKRNGWIGGGGGVQ